MMPTRSYCAILRVRSGVRRERIMLLQRMTVRIRPMTADDVERVAALCAQLGYPSTPAEVAARFNALSTRANHATFVAEQDAADGTAAAGSHGAVIGWVHVREVLTIEAGPFADLGGLVVDETARAQGAGRALVEAAEQWAIGRGYREMRVRSNVVRADAHRFYRQLGYEVFKTQLNFRKPLQGPRT